MAAAAAGGTSSREGGGEERKCSVLLKNGRKKRRGDTYTNCTFTLHHRKDPEVKRSPKRNGGLSNFLLRFLQNTGEHDTYKLPT